MRGRFGASSVFMDVTDIEAGVDFVDVLQRAVGSCDVLLAVIGPEWLSSTDRRGRRRLDDPHDFIRLEIGTALKRNVRVIPVLVEGATMPAAEDLPADLEPLTRRQAVELRDTHWLADVDSLTSVLERLLAPRTGRGRRVTPGRQPPSEPQPDLGDRHRGCRHRRGSYRVCDPRSLGAVHSPTNLKTHSRRRGAGSRYQADDADRGRQRGLDNSFGVCVWRQSGRRSGHQRSLGCGRTCASAFSESHPWHGPIGSAARARHARQRVS